MSYSAESFEPLRQTIEHASKIVISSTVSKEEREEAEKIFIQFKESKSPYDFCSFLLQNSSDSHVLFQAVSTIQAAALREWSLLSTETILALQKFLFNYVTEVHTIEQYVQKQILQTVAVFYKRTKFDTFHSKHLGQQKGSQADKTNLVTKSIEIFSCSDLKMRQLICSFLFAVINEFSNTNKSTKLGQSTESHFNAKRSFEQNEFKSILLFVFDTAKSLIDSLIQSNITNICSVDKESKNLLIQIFNLIDQSFTWEFTSSRHVLKNLIGSTNQSASQSLEPTPEFRDFFLNPQLVHLLFRCYQLVRDDPDTAHFAIQPLIQLSTLKGSIFKDDGDNRAQVEFIGNFVDSLIGVFEANAIRDYESFNVSNTIENILLQSGLKHLVIARSDLIQRFFKLITSFLINCFKAERACQDATDSSKYLESYEKILVSWSNFKDSTEMGNNGNEIDQFNLIFRNYSYEIVEAFVQSRLSYQEDHEVIQLKPDEDLQSIESEDDSNEDDLHRYKDILYSIREFGRQSLELCLPLFSRLIAEKYEQMTGILKQIYQYQLSNRQVEQQSEQHLTKLSEDIHWLLLINGFVLFEISESEENKIPEKIMNYDASIAIDVNNLTNLSNLLDQPIQIHNQVAYPILNSINLSLIDAKVPNTFNPVISFAFTGMQLAELENHMFCLNMLQYLSPQVASTLAWFFKELCQSFLFMNESNYSFINPTLHHFFGPDTQSASTILKFLIRKILINFYIWSSETTCTIQTAKLLIELSKNRSVAKHLMQDVNYWSIGHVVTHSDQQPWKLLPSSVKKLAIKSLIISCLGQPNEIIVNSVQALGSRFEALNSESSSFHSESKIKEVMSLIESLNGIIEATSYENLNFLIGVILPRLEQGVHLLDRYHNYGEIVELVLDMYNGVVEKILTQLNVSLIEHVFIKNKILECFLGLIQIFAKHNQRRQSIDVNIEEDYFNDLLLFLTLLNRLHNINYDNDENRFLPIEPSTNEQNSVIKVIDVILIGLEFLIPLMSKEILKFQTLAIEYFRLTSNISFNNSDKIFSRPIQLYNSLISSIQFGLTSNLGVEVARHSLESIQPLCAYLFKCKMCDSVYAEAPKQLFRTFFQSIFDNSIELEVFDLSSNVLYSFICCFPYLFTDLVSQLIRTKFATSAELKQKIESGFKNLITLPNLSNLEVNLSMFNLEKRNRIKFNSRFNEFCIKTYGLLFIR